MRANTDDLQSIRLRQRVLRDVSGLDLSCTLFGRSSTLPIALAPVGLAGMFATHAEVAAATAAQSAGVPFTESTVSICGIEEVAAAVTVPPWFQLYVMRDRTYAESLMARANAVGCDTLLLTVDLPVVGERYRDTRNGMVGTIPTTASIRRGLDLATHPLWIRDVAIGGKPLTFGNLEAAVPGARTPQEFKSWVDAQFDNSVTWDDLAWVRESWNGRVVIKGVLDVEDARIVLDHGVDGLVVSNHGGRQLDDVPSTAAALGRIVEAVGTRTDIMVDGGVRSGLDVLKMLALGADGVLIGHAWAWAVATAGSNGRRARIADSAQRTRGRHVPHRHHLDRRGRPGDPGCTRRGVISRHGRRARRSSSRSCRAPRRVRAHGGARERRRATPAA